ncbi:MAG: hypothetical protein ACE5H6_02645 [Dehalococcoidia bacterium]
MVSAELLEGARDIIRGTLDAREEEAEVKERLRVMITSAGDPPPWAEVIKPQGIRLVEIPLGNPFTAWSC